MAADDDGEQEGDLRLEWQVDTGWVAIGTRRHGPAVRHDADVRYRARVCPGFDDADVQADRGSAGHQRACERLADNGDVGGVRRAKHAPSYRAQPHGLEPAGR